MELSTRTLETEKYGQVQLDPVGFKPTLGEIAAQVTRAVDLLPSQDKANPIALAGEVGYELASRIGFLTRQFPVEYMVRVQLGNPPNIQYATPILVVMGHSRVGEELPNMQMMGVVEDQFIELKRHLSRPFSEKELPWDTKFAYGGHQDPPKIEGIVQWCLTVKNGRKELCLRLTWEIKKVPDTPGKYTDKYVVVRGLCEPSEQVLTPNSSVTRMYSDKELRCPNVHNGWTHHYKKTDVTSDDVRQKIRENPVRHPQQKGSAGAAASASSPASAPPRISHQQAVQIAAQGGGLAALMPRMSGGVMPPVTERGELLQLTAGPSSAVALPWERSSAPALAWQGNDSSINGLD